MLSLDPMPASNPAPTAPWPPDGLEPVQACPVCGEARRDVVHRNLRDRVFFCAPGAWTLARCAACGTGYLDPRPTPGTIAQAYTTYYTHASAAHVLEPPKTAWRKHRLSQRNAYLNSTYGYHLEPAHGGPPPRLALQRRLRTDKLVRYLRFPGPGARVLDVGCSNGEFLVVMRAAGWEVFGVEPDPRSAAEARALGIPIHAGLLEAGVLKDNPFDAVTMHHVLEHLHDPVATLRHCWRTMKPGAVIYIATPNLDALGHRLFGSEWFALDPPRHLVLFTPASLRLALTQAGFVPDPNLQLSLDPIMFAQSARIQRGLPPLRKQPRLPLAARLRMWWRTHRAHRQVIRNPDQAEELVLLARKPAA